MSNKILIYNAILLDKDINQDGALYIENGKIISVYLGQFDNLDKAKKLVCASDVEYYDANKLTVTPAFIDMHVHLRYPGQEQKEDLQSGLKACAHGGFGTVVAMPNTNPVISSKELALEIQDKGNKVGFSRMFQSVSLTKDFNGTDTEHLNLLDCKQTPVITEDGHDVLSTATMLQAMKIAAQKGIIVSCHSEDVTLAQAAKPFRQQALQIMQEYGLSAWGAGGKDIKSIKPEIINQIDNLLTNANELLALAEDTATVRNILIACVAGCHVHIAHCSTKNSIDAVRLAKNGSYGTKQGFKVTCEVTPHHLALSGTQEPNIRALVNPPLRSEQDRQALIQALKDGTADVISTDHAPHTLQDKAQGSPGFTGIETSYAICNTVLVNQNGFSANQLSKLMSANPAEILKLNKGILRSGFDADLTFINPHEEWTIDSKQFVSKGKATPFDGMKVIGKVHNTMINGRFYEQK